MAKAVYGPDIFEAIGSGDLAAMKAAARRAEEHVREHGNVEAALAALQAEIARYERDLGVAH